MNWQAAEIAARERIIVALDVPTSDDALALVRQLSPHAGATCLPRDRHPLHFGSVRRVRRAGRSEVSHADNLPLALGHENESPRLLQSGPVHRLEVGRARRPECHAGVQRLGVEPREPSRVGRLGDPGLYFASCTCLSSAFSTCVTC